MRIAGKSEGIGLTTSPGVSILAAIVKKVKIYKNIMKEE